MVMIGRALAPKKDFVEFLYLDISSNSCGHTLLVVWLNYFVYVQNKKIEL
jgi:hypothetical protein